MQKTPGKTTLNDFLFASVEFDPAFSIGAPEESGEFPSLDGYTLAAAATETCGYSCGCVMVRAAGTEASCPDHGVWS